LNVSGSSIDAALNSRHIAAKQMTPLTHKRRTARCIGVAGAPTRELSSQSSHLSSLSFLSEAWVCRRKKKGVARLLGQHVTL
jgi:hypothetical protein